MSAAEIVREWIGLKPDLDSKIPRAEVVEIEACVQAQLEALLPGCRHTVTGGYRRGKPESNDVDIVFCPPGDEMDVGRLLRDLVTRMTDLGERFARDGTVCADIVPGIITHVLRKSCKHVRTSHSDPSSDVAVASNHVKDHANFDGLDKAFVLFRLPPTQLPDGTIRRRLTRRVDFIFAPKNKYALAVLGWSGSMIFERDLKCVLLRPIAKLPLTLFPGDTQRMNCKSSRVTRRDAALILFARNLKFDSGRFADRSTGEEYFPKTEREIFDILGLRYVRPQWRNADA